ncbi:MAG: hypothetical protein ACE5E1_01990 [Phycisphaerae bacterium]
MSSTKQKLCALIAIVLPVGMTGCFGESILSAAAKVAGGQIASLTANEIKILNQTAIDLFASQNPGVSIPVMNDAQAEALANFFAANNLNTLEDFDALQQTAQTDPGQIQGLDELASAFAGSDNTIDPNNVDPETLGSIFDGLFGGSGPGGPTTGSGAQPNP